MPTILLISLTGSYSTSHFFTRYNVFKSNLDQIEAHNDKQNGYKVF